MMTESELNALFHKVKYDNLDVAKLTIKLGAKPIVNLFYAPDKNAILYSNFIIEYIECYNSATYWITRIKE